MPIAWWIITRALGSARRMPGSPAARRSEPIEHACNNNNGTHRAWLGRAETRGRSIEADQTWTVRMDGACVHGLGNQCRTTGANREEEETRGAHGMWAGASTCPTHSVATGGLMYCMVS